MSEPALDIRRATAVRELAEAMRSERGALLPILHRVVDELGYVTHADTAIIADVLNLSEADVHGVATFYKDFRRSPAARCVVQVCRAEACQAVGANNLVEHATSTLGIGMDEQTQDGAVELEQVFCLGNCALGPAITVDGTLYGRVGPSRFDAILAGARR